MAYEYKTITNDQRAEIAQQQVAQFEAEHFQHELNIARIEAAAGKKPDEEAQKAIDAARAAQDTIESAIAVTEAEVAKLAPTEE